MIHRNVDLLDVFEYVSSFFFINLTLSIMIIVLKHNLSIKWLKEHLFLAKYEITIFHLSLSRILYHLKYDYQIKI